MAQVPDCDCGGACSSLNVNTGFCREDTGDPVLITTVCSCNGFTITTTVTDLATGDPYTGPLMVCSPEIYDVADTNSIDMTLAGTVFSSDLRIDPASLTPLSITADGLYAGAYAAPDAWTTQVKPNDQNFASVNNSTISGLTGFNPVANGVYEIEGKLIVSSSATNIGVRPSMEFPTGMTHTAHYVATADSAYNNHIFTYGGPQAQTTNNNAPAANVGFLARITGVIAAGPNPQANGFIRPNMASEANGSQVTVHAGSMFKWRKIN